MEVIGQLTAVSGVLALLLAALWWLRRRGFARITAFAPVLTRGNGRRLERLERVVLSPQHALHLVRVADTVLLVAASPGGCALLQSMPASALEAAVREPEK